MVPCDKSSKNDFTTDSIMEQSSSGSVTGTVTSQVCKHGVAEDCSPCMDELFAETHPPYQLSGLLILTYLSLGVRMADVSIISDHIKTIFPGVGAMYGSGLSWRIQQTFNRNPAIFAYMYGQNEEKRQLNMTQVHQNETLFDRMDSHRGSGFVQSIYFIAADHEFDLRQG